MRPHINTRGGGRVKKRLRKFRDAIFIVTEERGCPIYNVGEEFEVDEGGFTADPIWERATPTAGGPAAGFSGDYCFGVGMDENYGDDVFGTLTSPSYDFSGPEVLMLSFHYWCETEAGYDGANVQVWSAATDAWVTVYPFGGYPSVSLSGIGYAPGWSGS